MTYPELKKLIEQARSGNSEAAVELSLLYRSDYAHSLLAEASRLFHLLLFKTTAMQLSQSFKALLERNPQIAQTVNNYKDSPNVRNLNTMLETLLSVGRGNGDEMLTKISILITRSFKTLAKEHDEIINKIMPEYSSEISDVDSVTQFKERSTFKTFVEELKDLSNRFKSYDDRKRSKETLLYAVNLGSNDAVKILAESWNIPSLEVIPGPQLNNSLLGRSYNIVTIWDKAREYRKLPI